MERKTEAPERKKAAEARRLEGSVDVAKPRLLAGIRALAPSGEGERGDRYGSIRPTASPPAPFLVYTAARKQAGKHLTLNNTPTLWSIL